MKSIIKLDIGNFSHNHMLLHGAQAIASTDPQEPSVYYDNSF